MTKMNNFVIDGRPYTSSYHLTPDLKLKWVPYYLEMAMSASKLSDCTSLQVGCVTLTKSGLLSIGINGTVPGWHTNCAEDIVEGVSKTRHAETLHAEQNMIMKLASSTQSGKGSYVFCTDAPCGECAKLLAALGIEILFFSRIHKRTEGLALLVRLGVKAFHVEHKDDLVYLNSASDMKLLEGDLCNY